MLGLYHSKDLDGFACGAIIKHRYPDAMLIGYDYNEPIPRELDEPTDNVIMADVSMNIMAMRFYAEAYNRVGRTFTWIDHHISAIEEFYKIQAEMGSYITPVLDNSLSACEITWHHLFPNTPIPAAIRLLGEYDTWRNQDKTRWKTRILPFQWGMRVICDSPQSFPRCLLEEDIDYGRAAAFINETIMVGQSILTYQKMQDKRACTYAFETTFQELRAICLNAGGGNSQMFETVYDESKHDVMIPFYYSGHGWTFSLYTTKDEVDCSRIAKMLGGGGHRKAAGWKCKDLPNEFKLNKDA